MFVRLWFRGSGAVDAEELCYELTRRRWPEMTRVRVCVCVCGGGLGLSIEGPSKAEIQCQDNKDGTCTITYVPTLPGEYKIAIKYAGQPITDTPYFAKISTPCKCQHSLLDYCNTAPTSGRLTSYY